MEFLKKYWWVLLIVLALGIGIYMYYQKDDALLTKPVSATPELKAAIEKKLGKEFLAKKGSTRSYQAALDSLWKLLQTPAEFEKWIIKASADKKQDAVASITPLIQEWSSNTY